MCSGQLIRHHAALLPHALGSPFGKEGQESCSNSLVSTGLPSALWSREWGNTWVVLGPNKPQHSVSLRSVLLRLIPSISLRDPIPSRSTNLCLSWRCL